MFKFLHALPTIVWCFSFIDGIHAKKPHIILIVADDIGWNDVSFHGSKQIPTPHIDKLASAGVILNNYYTLPTCTPSRAALLTGKYPIHTGMQGMVIEPPQTWGLGLNETLLPQYLKLQGYSTHQVGKWHLGHFAKEYTPTYRGFDTYFGNYLGWNDYWNYHNNEAQDGLDMHDGFKPFPGTGEYSTEVLTKQAEDRINTHDATNPMFLYLAYTAPHTATEDDPNQAPQEWIDKYKHIKHEERRKYAAMVGYLDHGIGRIEKALEKKGMWDDAVIVFSADNGGAPSGFHNGWASNHPLRGTKASLFEGGIRGAAFVYSKMLQHPGTVSHDLIHISDWLPTFVKLAGGRIPKHKKLDGMDMWGNLQNKEPSPRKEILLNIDDDKLKNAALRVGDWKIVKQGGGIGILWSGWYPPPEYKPDNSSATPAQVKCGPAPTNWRQCLRKYCLFNIKKDPCEYNNLAKKYPEKLKKMVEKLDGYRSGMVPSRHNGTADPQADPALHGGVWEPWVILQH